jgi:ribosomal protein S8
MSNNLNSLANLFSHLKNAQQSRILLIEHPQSKLILSILDTFQECGYIRGYRVMDLQNVSPFLDQVSEDLQKNITSSASFNHSTNNSFLPCVVNKSKKRNYPKIEILLKYKNQKPAINNIICIAKPSKRFYLSVKKLSHILTKKTQTSFVSTWDGNLSSLLFMKGILILSTSKGIMTHLTAYRLNIGGQVLCHIS